VTCTTPCTAPAPHAILPAPHGCVSCPLIPPPCGTPHCACGAQAVHRVSWRASFRGTQQPTAHAAAPFMWATTPKAGPWPRSAPEALLAPNQQRYHTVAATRRQHRHVHQPLAASEGTRNEATRPSAVLRLRSRRGLALLEAVQAARATPAAAVAVPAIWPGAAMSRCFGVWQHTERSDLASERGSRRRFVAKCDTSQSQSHKILHLAATVGPTSHTVRACPDSFSCLRARRESPARGLLVKSNVYPTSSCMGWPQRAGVFRQPCCGSASRA
jgi:hypothetical protein